MISSRRIRTGLIGFGLAGRVFHASLLAADDRYLLSAVVTGDVARRAEAAALFPAARLCSSSQELFEGPGDLDLVIIAAPPTTHVGLAHEALDRGVAVVLDKPLSVTARDGTALVERATELGLPLTVFQNRRWDGDFLTLRTLVENGSLSGIRRFESRYEWWKPAETKRWKAEATPAEGGGVLYDLGAHLIDQAIVLFGPVERVYAELAAHRVGGGRADDDTFVSLWHSSGVRSQLWMNGMAAQVGPRFHVLGASSAYTKWGLDGQEASLKSGKLPSEEGYGVEPEATWGVLGADGALQRVRTERGDYPAFYAALAESLRNGGPLPVDPRDAVAVIEVIENIHRDFGLQA
jgi:scyllo-inositol 2-dehydrogenase (NADP+)